MMKNAVLVMLAILAMAGAFVLGTCHAAQKTPTAHPDADDALRALNLQKTCADGATAFYKAGNPERYPRDISSYSNHYDAKRDRCFVLTMSTGSSGVSVGHTVMTTYMLADAFDGTDYGRSSFVFDTANPAKPTVTFLCQMFPDGAHLSTCHSQDEWTAYVATFGIHI